MNIVELIFSENSDHSGVALIEANRSCAYPELIQNVRSIACQLEAIGLKRGEYVAICLRGGIDYIMISLAVLLCGGILVPIIETAGEEEIRSLIRTAGTEILISSRKFSGLQELAIDPTAFSKPAFVFRIPQNSMRDQRIQAIDAAFVRFSSGTTGASKGVILSHRAIQERTDAADKALRMGRNDRVIWVLNMSFHFVVTILLFLRRGAAIIIVKRISHNLS